MNLQNILKHIPYLRDRISGLKQYRQPDWMLIGIIGVLLAVGLMAVYTTTVFPAVSGRNDIPANAFAGQVRAMTIGLVLFVLLSVVDYGLLRVISLPLAALCIAALLGVAISGTFVAGAKRAFLNGSITPSEITKVAMIIYAATWLASRRNQVQSILLGLIPYSMFVGAVAAIVYMQPDLSTALVIVASTGLMFILAGASARQMLLGALVAAGAFVGVILLRGGHTTERWSAFVAGLNGYDQMHSHLKVVMQAIGNGGLFGVGLGFGVVKHRLPAVDTDSVIAALAEELGLFGLLAILGLFCILLWRCMRVVRQADSAFGQFLVIGIMSWLFLQMAVNLLGNLQLMPLPGVPVPFLSRGGSSIVAVLAACGILVSVSRGSVLSFTNNENVDDEQLNNRRRQHRTALRNDPARVTRTSAAGAAVRRGNSGSRAAGAQRTQVFDSRQSVEDYAIVGRCVKRDIERSRVDRSRSSRFESTRPTGVARIVRWKR